MCVWLCVGVRLLIKEALVTESARCGFLKRGAARSLLKIDIHRTHKIFDFVVQAGWVNGVEDEAGQRYSGPGAAAYPAQ